MFTSLKRTFYCIGASLSAVATLSGCTGVPEGTTPVASVDAARYQGTWYEIARFDHRFERGLQCVTAQYSPSDDGGIKVINTGYNPEKQEWSSAEGKAYFEHEPHDGQLKVSFFGPFYSGYNILVLDQDYQYALVSGPNRDYLWILSRTPTLSPETYDALVNAAAQQRFDVQQLLKVDQTSSACQQRHIP